MDLYLFVSYINGIMLNIIPLILHFYSFNIDFEVFSVDSHSSDSFSLTVDGVLLYKYTIK